MFPRLKAGMAFTGRILSRLAVTWIALSVVFTAAAASAAPAEQALPAAGAIVALRGTPHLWIADSQGTLHWSGDTRALAGRAVNWAARTEVSLEQLRAMRRGKPWLSAGLLKDGDPIYFVKWESDWSTPQLLHILSIADVELFGISATNYGQLVLDRTTWEQRFNVPASSLQRGVLPSTTGPAGAAVSTSTSPTFSVTSIPAVSVASGALAGALTAEEQAAFIESALDATDGRRATKWAKPITVQLRRSTYDTQGPLVDAMINEARELLGGHSISRVASGGVILIDFAPLSEVRLKESRALGYASYSTFVEAGTLAQCAITVAHDPEEAMGAEAQFVSPQMKADLLGLVVRHEFGHCLGLGHNASSKSFLSYSFDGLRAYYTSGARAARYPDFDRALIRTLYHAAVQPKMDEAALSRLFGA